jgi:cell division protein FtsW
VVAGSVPVASGSSARGQGRWSVWLARLESPLAAYYLVLGSVVALVAIGLVMVLSSSNIESYVDNDGNSYAVFSKHAMFAAFGLPLAWVASRVPIRVWKGLAWPALGVAVLSLLAVAAVGTTVNGNRNWLAIGPITVQPSEAAKLALVVWAAAVLSRKQSLLNQVMHVLVPVVPGAFLLLALVMLGHDLGTALVLVGIVAGLLFTAGAPVRVFAGGGALAAGVIAALVFSSPNRMQRIGAWSGRAECDYYDTCWQSTHGLWGLATGGWWGVGLGASREKWSWLPEAHNDYIFAVIGEELGLAGTLAVLVLFAALGIGLFRLVIASDDLFVKIATGGVLAWVLGQAVINIGTVLGVLPVIGLPLPLVSSGGSALVMALIALGMVLGFARQVPGAPEALAARPKIVHRSFAVLPRRAPSRARQSRRRR